jgi:hypothetical protein
VKRATCASKPLRLGNLLLANASSRASQASCAIAAGFVSSSDLDRDQAHYHEVAGEPCGKRMDACSQCLVRPSSDACRCFNPGQDRRRATLERFQYAGFAIGVELGVGRVALAGSAKDEVHRKVSRRPRSATTRVIVSQNLARCLASRALSSAPGLVALASR